MDLSGGRFDDIPMGVRRPRESLGSSGGSAATAAFVSPPHTPYGPGTGGAAGAAAGIGRMGVGMATGSRSGIRGGNAYQTPISSNVLRIPASARATPSAPGGFGVGGSAGGALVPSASANSASLVPAPFVPFSQEFKAAPPLPCSPMPTEDEAAVQKKVLAQLLSAAGTLHDCLSIDEAKQTLPSSQTAAPGKSTLATKASARLDVRHTVPFPKAILDELSTVSFGTRGGLLPEIGRAYITIDEKLFLWDYQRGTSLFKYHDVNQLIVSICLVRPRPGLFVDRVRYLLVIAYPLEVVMLAVECAEHGKGDIELYNTGFSVPTDNVRIRKLIGTQNGRVLMCGDDGCVYEIVYHGDAGWMNCRKRCRKVNHSSSPLMSLLPSFLFGSSSNPIKDVVYDNSRDRHYLFTLTDRNVIEVWSLGEEGEGMTHVVSNNTILQDLQSTYAQLKFASQPFSIVSLSPIPKTESVDIVLMAVTSLGHRVYFELSSMSSLSTSLRVSHVKAANVGLPAGYVDAAGTISPAPRNVTHAIYRSGHLLMADQRPTDPRHVLISISRDLHLNEDDEYADQVELVPLSAPVFDIAEMTVHSYRVGAARFLYADGQSQPLAGLRELAVQHAAPPREFLCLTSQGLTRLVQRWPVTDLANVLSRRRLSRSDDELRQFIRAYGVREASSMCLALACCQGAGRRGVATSATSAYSSSVLMSGGGGGGARGSVYATPSASASTSTMSSSASSIFNTPGGADIGSGISLSSSSFTSSTPSSSSSSSASLLATPGPGLSSSAFDESLAQDAAQAFLLCPALSTEGHKRFQVLEERKNSLALFLSRLLRPLWEWSVTVRVTSPDLPNGPSVLRLRYTSAEFDIIRAPLVKLAALVDKLWADIAPPPPPASSSTSTSASVPNGRPSSSTSTSSTSAALSASSYAASIAGTIALEGKAEEEALQGLRNVRALLRTSIEALFLFSELSQMSVDRVTAKLVGSGPAFAQKTLADSLSKTLFKEIVTKPEGVLLARQLVLAMLLDQPEGAPQTGLDLEDRLARTCPFYFSDSDFIRVKAQRFVERARAPSLSPSDRAAWVSTALDLYKKAAKQFSFNLPAVVRYLVNSQFYEAAALLSMHTAELLSQSPCPIVRPASLLSLSGASDAEWVSQRLSQAHRCLADVVVTLLLGYIPHDSILASPAATALGSGTSSAVAAGTGFVASSSTSTSTSSASLGAAGGMGSGIGAGAPGGAGAGGAGLLSPEVRKIHYDAVMARVLTASSPMLQHVVYAAFLELGKLKELASFKSPVLEEFLWQHERHDVLKDYYITHGMQLKAALLLKQLAFSTKHPYVLADRQQFLAKALGCAQSISTYRSRDIDIHDFIIELRERAEVTKIQIQAYTQVAALAKAARGELLLAAPDSPRAAGLKAEADRLSAAEAVLNSRLLDLDPDLYRLALSLQLWEVSLSILDFAKDARLVEHVDTLWSNMIRHEISRAQKAHSTWEAAVAERVAHLFAKFGDSEGLCPLQHIASTLEQLRFEYGNTHANLRGYVVETLLNANVSVEALMDTYMRIMDIVDTKPPVMQMLLVWSVVTLLRSAERTLQSENLSTAASSRSAMRLRSVGLSLLKKCPISLLKGSSSAEAKELLAALVSLEKSLV